LAAQHDWKQSVFSRYWYSRDVLEYALPLYFIFASQLQQSTVPLYRIGIVSGGTYQFMDRKWKYCDASVHRWIVTPLVNYKHNSLCSGTFLYEMSKHTLTVTLIYITSYVTIFNLRLNKGNAKRGVSPRIKIWSGDLDVWPWKSIGFQTLLRTKYVPSLVKIHWRMLILECSQGKN
jgi:hypothetical protein